MKHVRIPIAVALVAVLVTAQVAIDAKPEKKEMIAAQPFHKLPPSQYVAEYTASMLLGGLRAVAIDYLWLQFIRAERNRQHLEVMALLEMIAYLQPSFSEVWNHLSWAQAYNIAAQMETREERWLWVKAGIASIDKAIERNPGNEKLVFQRGYLFYHRVPQEEYMMDKWLEEKGIDCYGEAALTLQRAIEMAQEKGLDNTRPPGDGMMQESYNRWAFLQVRRGEFEKAEATLRRGHDVYKRLMTGRPITDMNQMNNQLFLDLIPVFRKEQELWKAKGSGEAETKLEDELLAMYLVLELGPKLDGHGYIHCNGVELRITELLARMLRRGFDEAAAGRRAEAIRVFEGIVEKYLFPLTDNTKAGANAYWGTVLRYHLDLNVALEAEGRDKAEAIRLWEKVLVDYRSIFPENFEHLKRVRERLEALRK